MHRVLIALALMVTACEPAEASVSLRVEGSADCTSAYVTVLTSPPLGEGEARNERTDALLPFETTRVLSSRTDVQLIANAPSCGRMICTLVVEGREVARTVGTPWQERGQTTTCNWRAP